MSLESKIEILTSAINALNVTIGKLVDVPMCDNPHLAAEILERELPKVELASAGCAIVEHDTPPALTHKDLQDFLLAFVREDMKRKPKIKKLLASYSAGKVSDLDIDKLELFKAELVAL